MHSIPNLLHPSVTQTHHGASGHSISGFLSRWARGNHKRTPTQLRRGTSERLSITLRDLQATPAFHLQLKPKFHKSPRTLRIKSHFHYQVPEEVGSLFLLNTRFAKSLSGFNNHTYNAAKDGFQQKNRDPSTDTLNLHRLNCYPLVLRLICLLMVWNFLSIHVFFQAFICALPILKASPWSGAKSSLYGFHSVMFSHGLIVLTNSCWLWYDPLNSHHLFLFVTLW